MLARTITRLGASLALGTALAAYAGMADRLETRGRISNVTNGRITMDVTRPEKTETATFALG